jgi:hypothetical protein
VHLQFGWHNEPFETKCDYVCNGQWGEIFLICTHGKTIKELETFFEKKAENCPRYESGKDVR